MSTQTRPKRLSVTQIRGRKGGDKIVCLTAYTASVARLLDHEVGLLLVGDSLAMTVYGFDSTLPVTLDMMIAHGAAVVRSTEHALIVVDLPFGSYQASPADAFRAAARVLAETGCAAVKLEGGEEMAETVAFLVGRGVPVMGHVGLTPQSVNALGGYRSRGHAAGERDKIMCDGIAIDRKSTRLNSSHRTISYAVFCLKKKKKNNKKKQYIKKKKNKIKMIKKNKQKKNK